MPHFTVKYAPEALQEIQAAIDYYNKLSDKNLLFLTKEISI